MRQNRIDFERPAWIWRAAALAVFVVLLFVVLKPESSPWPWGGGQRHAVQIGDVVYAPNAREWQGARAAALQTMSSAGTDALLALEAEIDERLAQLFELPRGQVGVVAEWYYSAPGQLMRAAAPLGVDVSARLIQRLFPAEDWSEQQAMLVAKLAVSADQHLRQTGEQVLSSFHRQLQHRRPELAPAVAVPALSFDFGSNEVFLMLEQDPALERQALALATSTLSALAVRRALHAAAARSAARQAGTSLSAACVSTGALAWLCAGGVFSVTLLSTELVLMRVDEAYNRADFEAALHAELDRIESEFASVLREAYLGALVRGLEGRQQQLLASLRPVDVLFGAADQDER